MTIKELRTEKKLSQSALAKQIGIATSAIGHMENGRMKISAKIAAKVKELYGVDLTDEAAKAPAKAEKKTAAKKPAAKKEPAKKTEKTAAKAELAKTVKADKKPAAKKAPAKKAPVKKPAEKKAPEKKFANEVIIQSPMGGVITPAEVLAKVGPVDQVYVRVDQNKAYWVRGKETGAVELW